MQSGLIFAFESRKISTHSISVVEITHTGVTVKIVFLLLNKLLFQKKNSRTFLKQWTIFGTYRLICKFQM